MGVWLCRNCTWFSGRKPPVDSGWVVCKKCCGWYRPDKEKTDG